MTVHDADLIGYADITGRGEGNWSRAVPHDADQVLGHLQHYRTREGRRIRLARYRDVEPYVAPEPYVHDWRRTVREIVLPFVVVGIWAVAFGIYFAIAAATQVPAR